MPYPMPPPKPKEIGLPGASCGPWGPSTGPFSDGLNVWHTDTMHPDHPNFNRRCDLCSAPERVEEEEWASEER